jgi:glycine/D-amino acid oxidase-like deaminating enzyme
MDLHSDYPFSLIKNGLVESYPQLEHDCRTEIVVMGAGITGALAAWYLCKNGYQVVVVDRRHVGMGSTAASTSLLQYEIDTPFCKLARLIGEEAAARSYLLCIEAIYNLRDICQQLNGDAGFELKESFQFASSASGARMLRKEMEIRKKHGIKVEWLDRSIIRENFGFTAPGGLLSAEGGQVDAYLLTHMLLKDCVRMGASVFDTTEVVDIRSERHNMTLKTLRNSRITASFLVIACGYESQRYVPKKVEKLHSTYAIISKPTVDQKYWYNNCLIWETARPYLYLRVTSDGRAVIGGKDDSFSNPKKRDRVMSKRAHALEVAFHKLFPAIPFTTDFRWAGVFADTKDGLPYIGVVPGLPRQFFALGFGGNGITFSEIAGRLLVDHLKGKSNPCQLLFSFDR